MSDIQLQVQNFRREQMQEYNLLPFKTDLYEAANKRILQLREAVSMSTPEEFDNLRMEAENIQAGIEEIQETRAELIWDLAYSDSGTLDLMTLKEKTLYIQAADIARKMRSK